jgi:beta-galactosidase
VGDIYTINNYLNFMPLQEREEWLSAYAQKGDMPLMYVEFGTPVNIGLMRGRNGFIGAYKARVGSRNFSRFIRGRRIQARIRLSIANSRRNASSKSRNTSGRSS